MAHRIGLIGVGVVAKYYIQALLDSPRFELASLCDKNRSRMLPYADRVPNLYTKYHEMLVADELDAVVVALPNHLHYGVCRTAIQAGRHVCCEKPLTIRLDHAQDLCALARCRNVSMLTAFHRRYNTHYRSLLADLGSGGRIRGIVGCYLERIEDHAGEDEWYLDVEKCGGGCIADNGPNLFDLVTFLMGPVSVDAVDVEWVGGIDMKATVQLRSESGVEAVCHLDWAFGGGERKELLVKFKDGSESKVDLLRGFAEFKSSLWHEYVGIANDFADLIESGQDGCDAGLNSVGLVEEVYLRARSFRG